MAQPSTTLVIEADRPWTSLTIVGAGRSIDRRWLPVPAAELSAYLPAVTRAALVLAKRVGVRPGRVVVVQEAVGGDGGQLRPDAAILAADVPLVLREVSELFDVAASYGFALSRAAAVSWAHARFGVGATLRSNDATGGPSRATGQGATVDQVHVGFGCDVGGLIIAGELVGHSVLHLPVQPAGPSCACGKRGCLAAFTSLAALYRLERLLGLDGLHPSSGVGDHRLLSHLAQRVVRDRCSLAREIFSRTGRAIGLALAGLLNAADLRDVVVHAPADAWAIAEPIVRATIARHTFAATREDLRFTVAVPSSEAASIGAAGLCRINPTACRPAPLPQAQRPN
jgi:hypothetical protein